MESLDKLQTKKPEGRVNPVQKRDRKDKEGARKG